MNLLDQSPDAIAYTRAHAERALSHLDPEDRAAVDAWHAQGLAEVRREPPQPSRTIQRTAGKVGLAVGLLCGLLAWVAGSGRIAVFYPAPMVVEAPAATPTPVVCPTAPACPVCPALPKPEWFRGDNGLRYATVDGMTCYWPDHTPTIMCVRADNTAPPDTLPPLGGTP